MTLKVRLFAMLREHAGQETIDIEISDGATVSELLSLLKEREDIGEMIERIPVLMARNRSYVDEQAPLEEGDELALIPPVSGGAAAAGGPVHVRIKEGSIKTDELLEQVRRPTAGAAVTFFGTTRDVPYLHYEAYVEMAEEKIREIAERAVEEHGLEAAAVEHRIGRVERCEPSVVIAVSAVHREEAFTGAREIIDSIKATAPIWKKEAGEVEEKWVKGVRPPS